MKRARLEDEKRKRENARREQDRVAAAEYSTTLAPDATASTPTQSMPGKDPGGPA